MIKPSEHRLTNHNLRALLITAGASSLLLIWFKPETEYGIAVFCCGIAVFFGVAASWGREFGNFNAQLDRVIDGQTVQVLFNRKRLTLNLYGLDCPEKDQSYWHESKNQLANHLRGKDLTFRESEATPEAGRKLKKKEVHVLYANGQDVNLWMLASGHAWHTNEYKTNPEYENATTQAKYQPLGVYASGDEAPWLRRNKKAVERTQQPQQQEDFTWTL